MGEQIWSVSDDETNAFGCLIGGCNPFDCGLYGDLIIAGRLEFVEDCDIAYVGLGVYWYPVRHGDGFCVAFHREKWVGFTDGNVEDFGFEDLAGLHGDWRVIGIDRAH